MRATADLRRRILNRTARVAVVGQGYVGLSLACAAAEAGFCVTGHRRRCPSRRGLGEGRQVVAGRRRADLPQRVRQRTAGLHHVGRGDRRESPGVRLRARRRCGTAPPICRSSTVPAETSRRAWRPGRSSCSSRPRIREPPTSGSSRCLETSGLLAGRDFLLAYSPERIDPGNAEFTFRQVPRVVGGMNPESTGLAVLFYEQLVDKVMPVSSCRAAELAKLLENTFRHVNIALANEMAMLCHEVGIDVWEVVDAAATKPFGFMPFYPGPGVGGHCIPLDPTYLSWQMRRDVGHQFRVLEEAEDINAQMPAWVAGRIAEMLNDARSSVKDANILVLGAAYKPDVGDVRESPAVKIMHQLHKRGARVEFHDPYVSDVTAQRHDAASDGAHEPCGRSRRPGRGAHAAQRVRPGLGVRAREARVRRAERVRTEPSTQRGAAVRGPTGVRFQRSAEAMTRRVGADVLVTTPADDAGARAVGRGERRLGGAARLRGPWSIWSTAWPRHTERSPRRSRPRSKRAWTPWCGSGSSRRCRTSMDDDRSDVLTRAIAGHGLPGVPEPEPTTVPDDVWQRLFSRIRAERISGLAVQSVVSGWLELSDEQATELLAAHRDSMTWCLSVERKLVGLAEAFDAEGIPFAVLKGASVAHTMYPDPSLRSFGDLDLLVSTTDYERACALLGRLGHVRQRPEPRPGFEVRFGKASVHKHPDDGIEVDLHRTLVLGPFGLWIDPDELLARREPFLLAGRKLDRLDDTAMLLNVAMHAALGARPPQARPAPRCHAGRATRATSSGTRSIAGRASGVSPPCCGTRSRPPRRPSAHPSPRVPSIWSSWPSRAEEKVWSPTPPIAEPKGGRRSQRCERSRAYARRSRTHGPSAIRTDAFLEERVGSRWRSPHLRRLGVPRGRLRASTPATGAPCGSRLRDACGGEPGDRVTVFGSPVNDEYRGTARSRSVKVADPILTVRNLTKVYEPSPFWLKMLLRSSIKEPVVALDGCISTSTPGACAWSSDRTVPGSRRCSACSPGSRLPPRGRPPSRGSTAPPAQRR